MKSTNQKNCFEFGKREKKISSYSSFASTTFTMTIEEKEKIKFGVGLKMNSSKQMGIFVENY